MPELSADDGQQFDLATAIEGIIPSSLAAHLDRDRPYDGQPQTDYGERGAQEITGITMRDLVDCFVRACFEASGLPPERWPGSVYQLPWQHMDTMAVAGNMTCWVEKYMGIYPNVRRLYPTDPTSPHWCGPVLESSVWQSHEGHCDSPVRPVPGPDDGEH